MTEWATHEQVVCTLTKPEGGQIRIASPEPPPAARRGLPPRELVLEPHEFITTVNAWSSDNHGAKKEGWAYVNYGAIGSMSVRQALEQRLLLGVTTARANPPCPLPLGYLPFRGTEP